MLVRASLHTVSHYDYAFRTQTPRTQLCMFLQKKQQGQHAELSLEKPTLVAIGIMYPIWKAQAKL